MENIKTILDVLFHKKNLPTTVKTSPVFEAWEKAVGSRIARHAKPKDFRDHTLWVTVDNSIWMQQLTFLEEKLKKNLNHTVGSAVIEKIRLQIGEIHSPSKDSDEEHFSEWENVALDEATTEEIEKEVAILKDEELKARLKNLFRKSAQFLTYKAKE